ncbi:MAG: hydroxyacid dehydrogenase, partial [Planctomycetes bacterium]|nr:hydroxyacid dehydrogenase [Planctomycetota bacterium]
MKLAIFNVSEWERAPFEALKASKGWDIHLLEERLDPSVPAPAGVRDADAIAVFVSNPVNEETLGYFPSLRCVLTRSTGFEHIDLEACKRRGVAAYYVPDYGSVTVAEYTLGLILALLRRFRPLIEQSGHGDFTRDNLRGIDLADKTVGVIGTGRIGREVIRRLKAFSTRVLAFDLRPDGDFARSTGVEYVDLESLYRSSNVLTFHVPLRPETHHIFDRGSLRLVPWK